MATLQPHSVVITSFKLFCISANLLKEAGASELLWCSNSYMAIFYWFQPKSKWVSDCLLSQIQGKPALPTSPANLSLTLTLVQINTQCLQFSNAFNVISVHRQLQTLKFFTGTISCSSSPSEGKHSGFHPPLILMFIVNFTQKIPKPKRKPVQ